MNTAIRPRRSVLYMPASNQRAMDKARELDVDAVIFDLEDAVAPAAKDEARRQACAQVRAGGYGHREVLIRVNARHTPWGPQDFEAALAARPDGIVLPKVEDTATLEHYGDLMREAGLNVPLWPMIETPTGVSHVDAIAAQENVAVLVMGTSDLQKELRVPDTPERTALLYALARTVNAARRYGRDVLDGVSAVLDDSAAFTRLCEQGRNLGFDGKTLIHPAQIGPANQVFGPSPEAVAQARRVLEAWHEAERQGRGIAVLDGRMVENLHAADAQRVVAFDTAIRQRR